MQVNKAKKLFSPTIIFWVIMLVAVILRIGKFIVYEGGLNQDEASIGYDAYALLNYGIDRNGVSLPVHLIAWGSGQNAMYAYLSMPFIAIFGLCAFSVRIVNFLAAIGTVAAVYFICKELFDKKTALIAMGLTAVAPWHIMLSTWGLESNLLPAMFTFALLLLVKSFKHPWLICLSAAVFSLCLYTYGSAYVAVPLFMLLAVITVIKNRLVPIKWISAAFVIFVIMSVPIGLFVLVNKFGWDSIKIGPFTIPAMTGTARINAMTGSFSLKETAKDIYNDIIMQNDGSYLNALPIYGCFYVISLPFTICGIIKAIRSKSIGGKLLIFALIGSLAVFFVLVGTNINRVNIIYIPLIMLTAVGINGIIKSRQAAISVLCAYAVMVCGFSATFYGKGYTQRIENDTYISLDDAILYADGISGDNTVYVTPNVNMPYIYVLFYTKENPHNYLETVQIEDTDAQFQWVNSFGKWEFNINGFFNGEKGIYIVDNDYVNSDMRYDIVQFKKYSVVTID